MFSMGTKGSQKDVTPSPLPYKTMPSESPRTHPQAGVFLFFFLETSLTNSLLASFLGLAGWLWEACKKKKRWGGLVWRRKQGNGERERTSNYPIGGSHRKVLTHIHTLDTLFGCSQEHWSKHLTTSMVLVPTSHDGSWQYSSPGAY